MTLNLLVVVCDFLIGFFVISTGGGGAALYLGVLTGLCGLSAAHAVDTSLLTAIPPCALVPCPFTVTATSTSN